MRIFLHGALATGADKERQRDGTKREREVTNNILQKKNYREDRKAKVTLRRVRGDCVLVARRTMHEKRHKILSWL